VSEGLLRFHALRPTAHGLELHLTTIYQLVQEFAPRLVVVDAITSFLGMGVNAEITSMIVRLIDFLKTKGITLYMTSLTDDRQTTEPGAASIASIVDTWILLRDVETDGARVRTLSIFKGRGMAHSNATHPFAITRKGVALKIAAAGNPS
jgi:circadian clock protein KaiC